MPERKPIFYDQERRRWRRTRRVLEVAGGLFTIVLVIFLINVGRNPELPDICLLYTSGSLPITAVHDITAALEDRVKERFPQIFRLTIHPEPVEES